MYRSTSSFHARWSRPGGRWSGGHVRTVQQVGLDAACWPVLVGMEEGVQRLAGGDASGDGASGDLPGDDGSGVGGSRACGPPGESLFPVADDLAVNVLVLDQDIAAQVDDGEVGAGCHQA